LTVSVWSETKEGRAVRKAARLFVAMTPAAIAAEAQG
jgi:hypothetical protein